MSHLRERTPSPIALKLAEPQRFLLDAFASVGLTPEVVGKTLLDVMQDTESQHRVEAARLMIDATIGRAPTSARSENLHLHAKAHDAFFDQSKFEKAPKPVLEDK